MSILDRDFIDKAQKQIEEKIDFENALDKITDIVYRSKLEKNSMNTSVGAIKDHTGQSILNFYIYTFKFYSVKSKDLKFEETRNLYIYKTWDTEKIKNCLLMHIQDICVIHDIPITNLRVLII